MTSRTSSTCCRVRPRPRGRRRRRVEPPRVHSMASVKASAPRARGESRLPSGRRRRRSSSSGPRPGSRTAPDDGTGGQVQPGPPEPDQFGLHGSASQCGQIRMSRPTRPQAAGERGRAPAPSPATDPGPGQGIEGGPCAGHDVDDPEGGGQGRRPASGGGEEVGPLDGVTEARRSCTARRKARTAASGRCPRPGRRPVGVGRRGRSGSTPEESVRSDAAASGDGAAVPDAWTAAAPRRVPSRHPGDSGGRRPAGQRRIPWSWRRRYPGAATITRGRAPTSV